MNDFAKRSRIKSSLAIVVTLSSIGACDGSGTDISTETQTFANSPETGLSNSDAPVVSATQSTSSTPALADDTTLEITPAKYLAEADILKIAELDESGVLLPTRVPKWAADARITVAVGGNLPTQTFAFTALISYPEGAALGLDSDLMLQFTSDLTDAPPKFETTVQGETRTYGTFSGSPACGDFGVLDWYENGRYFSIVLTPGPGTCSDGLQTVDDAIQFADSLVACRVNDLHELICESD